MFSRPGSSPVDQSPTPIRQAFPQGAARSSPTWTAGAQTGRGVIFENQAAERRQWPKDPSEGRYLPADLHVAGALGYQDDMKRPLTNDLVRDVCAIGGLGVSGLGRLDHRRTVCRDGEIRASPE